MSDSTEDYVSVIGSSFLHPIATLLESLESLELKGPGEVQASSLENGYSAAIVALTVFLLESALNRTRYVQRKSYRARSLDFFRQAFPGSGLDNRLEELFVVRDVVAHNHLWDAKIKYNEHGLELISASLLPEYGDKKFKKVVDWNTRKTRLLGLNVFPTRICRADAVIALKCTLDVLAFLEKADRRYFYITPQLVKFKEQMTTFRDLIQQLK